MNPLRIVTGVLGIMAAVLAVARGQTTLVWIAIGLLGSSMAVRIIQRVQARRDPGDRSESED